MELEKLYLAIQDGRYVSPENARHHPAPRPDCVRCGRPIPWFFQEGFFAHEEGPCSPLPRKPGEWLGPLSGAGNPFDRGSITE